jgi:alanyl-tRNA synthetase
MGESKEFCGGTHVARTGDIAFFLITEEAGVAQGVRRLEAVTGAGALGFVRRLEGELGETGRLLRAGSFEIAARVARLQADQREQQKEIEALRRKLASGGGGRDLASEARDVGGVRVLATRADVADAKALREGRRPAARQAALVRDRLAGVEGDKIALVAMVTPDLVGKFNAGKLVGEVAKAVGGKGGGRADMAQGGGSEPQHLDAALARVFDLVRG